MPAAKKTTTAKAKAGAVAKKVVAKARVKAAAKAPVKAAAKAPVKKKAPAAKNSSSAFHIPPFPFTAKDLIARNDGSEKVPEKTWWDKAGKWFNDLGERIQSWGKPEPAYKEAERKAREAEEECRKVSKQLESEEWWNSRWFKFQHDAWELQESYKRQAEQSRNKTEKEAYQTWSDLFSGLREWGLNMGRDTRRTISELEERQRNECGTRIKSIINAKGIKAIYDGTAGTSDRIRTHNATLYKERATTYRQLKPNATKLVSAYETGRSAVRNTQMTAYSATNITAIIGKPPEDPSK